MDPTCAPSFSFVFRASRSSKAQHIFPLDSESPKEWRPLPPMQSVSDAKICRHSGTRPFCIGENEERAAGTLTTPITNVSSSSSSTLLSSVPAAIWARSLDLLTHDDLLHCSVVSTFFLKEVSPLVGRIMVSQDSSTHILKYFPTKRFPNVKDVYLYNLINEIGDHAGIERDVWDEYREEVEDDTRISMAEAIEERCEFLVSRQTVEDAVPFLESFQKLETAFLGGLCLCDDFDGMACNTHEEWNFRDNVRCDLCFNLCLRGGGKHALSSLVNHVSRAYYQGRLDERVVISGLLPWSFPRDGDEISCPFKEYPGSIHLANFDARSRDSPCRTCRNLCSSFPPNQLCKMRDGEVPCIGMEERIRIAARRDPKRIKENLTGALVDTLSCPSSDGAGVISFDHHFKRIRCFVSRGANVKDPAILNTLLDKTLLDITPMKDGRIGMTEESFQMLRGLGIDVTKADFAVSTRTSQIVRTMARDSSGVV